MDKRSIIFIETSAVSSKELDELCKEIIPDVSVTHMVDNSLIREVNENGGPTVGVRKRMMAMYQNADSEGADLIVNQCSSVGEVADMIRPFVRTPILKIDSAMAEKAVMTGKKIGLIATVATTVGPSSRIIEKAAKDAGRDIELDVHLVKDAMMILIEKGDRELHNKMVLKEVEKAAETNDVIVLAQGSMTVLLPLLGHIKVPVLSSPRLCIERVRELLYK